MIVLLQLKELQPSFIPNKLLFILLVRGIARFWPKLNVFFWLWGTFFRLTRKFLHCWGQEQNSTSWIKYVFVCCQKYLSAQRAAGKSLTSVQGTVKREEKWIDAQDGFQLNKRWNYEEALTEITNFKILEGFKRRSRTWHQITWWP